MKQLTLVLLLVILIHTTTVAADLSDYPGPFVSEGKFNAQIIVGNNAPATDVLAASDIAVSLQQLVSTPITANLDDEVNNSMHGILIGQPCKNTAMAVILETNVCDIGLNENEGLIKLIEQDGRARLIITGRTAGDTRKAARVLANYRQHRLTGQEVIVVGSLDNPDTETPLQPIQIEKTQIIFEVKCQNDDDCNEDEWCLAEQCVNLGCPEGTKAVNHDCLLEEVAVDTTITENVSEAESLSEELQELPLEIEEKQEEIKGFFMRLIEFLKSFFS